MYTIDESSPDPEPSTLILPIPYWLRANIKLAEILKKYIWYLSY